jgi:hypothetical protein
MGILSNVMVAMRATMGQCATTNGRESLDSGLARKQSDLESTESIESK